MSKSDKWIFGWIIFHLVFGLLFYFFCQDYSHIFSAFSVLVILGLPLYLPCLGNRIGIRPLWGNRRRNN